MPKEFNHPIREEVRDFKPYTPGLSVEEIKQKYGLSRVLKMASNENPLGVSPFVQQALSQHAHLVFRYPQANNPELSRDIAQHLGVDPYNIVCGNGSDELIDLLIRLLAAPGRDNVAAFQPCFSIYKMQAKLSGVEFRQTPVNPDFSFAWEDLFSLVDERTRLVFLTNPDNPSGYAAPAQELREFASRLPDGCYLVVDEAYIDFARPREKYSALSFWGDLPNVIILRTFSKMFGLAGLRLGYAILPETLADYMRRIRLPFSVNILAEKAGQAGLRDEAFLNKTRSVILEGNEYLTHKLQYLGCQVYPSQANFIMFQPPGNAYNIFELLLSRGIIIRPLDSYGFPELLRVSIGRPQDNWEFLRYLQEAL